MPPNNKKKGGKRGRRGKKGGDLTEDRNIITIDAKSQRYYRITRKLGDCRMALIDAEGGEMIGTIRGKFRKRVWFNPGDIVICSIRSFQDDKVDIVHKYSLQEAKRLVKQNEIPQSLLGDEAAVIGGDDNVGDDGLVWNIGGDDDDEAEDGGNDDDGDTEPKIAAQPTLKNLDDISSDSYEYIKKKDTQSVQSILDDL